RRDDRPFASPWSAAAKAARLAPGSWSGTVNDGRSSSRRRYLAVWFPWLPSDRLARRDAAARPEAQVEAPSPPVVLVEKVKGALRLAAVDPTAARAGLTPGMTLADARARTPVLRTVVHRPLADDALLAAALEDFGRFSPMVA